MKRDYQKEMESVIHSLGGTRPKLLLHACCAPCTSAVIERVAPFFETTIYYFNPNIYPREEYDKRFAEFAKLLHANGMENDVKVINGEYCDTEFYAAAKGLEEAPEGGERCPKCFEMRLKSTAFLANAEGFDYFTTTLTVSPHKNAEVINAIGFAIAEGGASKWLPSDFKKKDGYLRSIRLSEEYGLYRQCYCGCRFALR